MDIVITCATLWDLPTCPARKFEARLRILAIKTIARIEATRCANGLVTVENRPKETTDSPGWLAATAPEAELNATVLAMPSLPKVSVSTTGDGRRQRRRQAGAAASA
jgi:hypothetical protein